MAIQFAGEHLLKTFTAKAAGTLRAQKRSFGSCGTNSVQRIETNPPLLRSKMAARLNGARMPDWAQETTSVEGGRIAPPLSYDGWRILAR